MKKLIKKLKKSNVLKKITVFSVITMILISSLTVSSFAADEEVSAANEEVNSITDTWTSILNWITGSLSSVQNVFLSDGLILFDPIFFDLGDGLLYSISNMPDPLPDSFLITAGSESFTAVLIDLVPSSSNFYSSRGYVVDDLDYVFLYYVTGSDGEFSGWMVPGSLVSEFDTFDFYYSSGSLSLTFLGTLSVVGVAIAIILLLISVIINFLKLRG